MSSVTTQKRIDLVQLAAELGGAELSILTDATGSTVTSQTVSQSALESAVAAHVAPDLVLLAANEATIRDRATTALGTNTTFLGIASPTNAQIAAQVKALTRQNNGLIRLVLRRFDATD